VPPAHRRTYPRQVTEPPPEGTDDGPLPLFPLGTVLFPGLVLPLHIFEERYRALVRALKDRPDGERREFGVVAIRRGWEVEQAASTVSLYDVGCTAQVRQITEHPDGTFDIVTVGRRRFTIADLLPVDTPYLQARVSYLAEDPGPEGDADMLAPRVLAAFGRYLRLVRVNAADIPEQLPEDPHVLSHLVAATANLTIAERQSLLATVDTPTRLRKELVLLYREVGLLSQVRAVPVTVADLPVRPGPN
jgi:Lon protease-like protein